LVNQNEVLVPNFLSPITADWFGDFNSIKDSEQTQIRAVLQNVATVTPGVSVIIQPFKWHIKVRCEEKEGMNDCTEPAKQDPCDDSNSPNAPPPDTTVAAYTVNEPYKLDYPDITFCPTFFKQRSLKDAMAYGASLPSPWKEHLDNFDNQGSTFLHELFHVNLAANTFNGSPNPRILDLQLDVPLQGRIARLGAYGSLLGRLLAKYDPMDDPFGSDVGFYTQRNGRSLMERVPCIIT
jgi:hypothetical protein